jgi:hypothetical protein
VPLATGYVKLHREVMDHPAFCHDGIFRLWCYCLLRANWKDSNWMIPGTTNSVVVSRGQFITGRESLHTELYGLKYNGESVSKPVSRTLWRWLESLERMQCITTQNVSNRCTLVTVCNYETYQNDDSSDCPAAVPPVSNRCPAAVPPVSTDKESKNIRKKEGKESSFETPIPNALDTPRFRAAWIDWKAHRLEIKKPLRPTQSAKQLSKLESIGELRAVAMIEHTIERGWQGLREPDGLPQQPVSRLPTPADDAVWTGQG